MRLRQQQNACNVALIVPADSEREIVPTFLEEINATDLRNSLIQIVNVSRVDLSLKRTQEKNRNFFQVELRVTSIVNGIKQGCGKAAIQGLNHFLNPHAIDVFFDMDTEGSNQISKVTEVLNHLIEDKADFKVDSRYIARRQISGWTIQGKLFSRALNIPVPKMHKFKITVKASGIGAYNSSAVWHLKKDILVTEHFVFVERLFLFLKREEFMHKEFSRNFIETIGKGRVGFREPMSAPVVLASIWKSNRR